MVLLITLAFVVCFVHNAPHPLVHFCGRVIQKSFYGQQGWCKSSFNPLVHFCGRVIYEKYHVSEKTKAFQSPCAFLRSGHFSSLMSGMFLFRNIVSIPLCISAVGSSTTVGFMGGCFLRFQSPCAFLRSGHKMRWQNF